MDDKWTWWKNGNVEELGAIEAADTHYIALYGRKANDGDWEYVAVFWRHHGGRPLWRLKGGTLEMYPE